MNDITELAQSWKTAAHKAKQANDLYLEGKITLSECVVETKDYLDYSDNPNNFLALVEALEKAQEGEKQWREVVDAFCSDDADWHKLTNSNNELISFLSVALCKQDDRIAELEPIRAAAEKLVRCKGRYHSELNYRALAALFGVNTPDLPPLEHENVHYADAAEMEIAALRQRITELESRTVTVKRSKRSVGEVMHMSGFSRDYAEGWCAGNDDAIHQICNTPGIKWEAE